MFTGLVETLGTLRSARPAGTGRVLVVEAPWNDLVLGESIAHDGVCLTVERFEGGAFWVTAGEETLRRTTLGRRQPGEKIHLERALKVGDRLGGHLVAGHVDGVGEVKAVGDNPDWRRIDIAVPTGLEKYVAEKGSICVDGVSLTVNEVHGVTFSVGIIPFTIQATKLGKLRPGDPVNLEVDVLARYVERQLGKTAGVDMELLKRSGFV